MKTNFFLIAVFTVALFSSCKKDRVCECTITSVYYNSNWTGGTSVRTSTYKKTTKKQIKEICKSYKEEEPNSTYTYDCKIK